MTHHHAHDPNPTPPTDDPSFVVVTPAGSQHVTFEVLRSLPFRVSPDSYIVSTGHGTSGPFAFGGTLLVEVIKRFAPEQWTTAQVTSVDGFATRLTADEWRPEAERPVLLAYEIDGRVMTRAQGLVRLIVPTETDEALRQIKWVGEVRLFA